MASSLPETRLIGIFFIVGDIIPLKLHHPGL
jgi:hypothetical protein